LGEYLGWEDDARDAWFRDLSFRIGVSSVLRFYGFGMAYGCSSSETARTGGIGGSEMEARYDVKILSRE
jgi:hypothetical protein